MRKLDPSNPLDRPLIAQNVTALAVAASMLAAATLILAAAISGTWPIRLTFGVLAALAVCLLAYQLWLFREVRRNPEFAASFEYRPRPIIRPGKQIHFVLALVGVGLLAVSGRLLQQTRIEPSGWSLWSFRAIAAMGVTTMLVAAFGLLTSSHPHTGRGG